MIGTGTKNPPAIPIVGVELYLAVDLYMLFRLSKKFSVWDLSIFAQEKPPMIEIYGL
jgi:hypothetical protein